MAHPTEAAAPERAQHAILITGGSAQDRADAALRLAMTKLCTAPGQRPCGVCAQCRKVRAGIHPDLSFLRPTNGLIRVDDVRTMRSDAFVLPGEAELRVFVIENAELMNEAAQNSALKILEEPPEHAAFLLETALPDALLPTVRSRCALLRLPGAPEPEPPEQAVRLVSLLARRDRPELALLCKSLEQLPRPEFSAFLSGCCLLLEQALRCKLSSERVSAAAQEAAQRLSAGSLLGLIRSLEQISKYCENNCGMGHMAGLMNAYCWEAIHID